MYLISLKYLIKKQNNLNKKLSVRALYQVIIGPRGSLAHFGLHLLGQV